MSTDPLKCSKLYCTNYVADNDINIHGVPYKKCQSCRVKDAANTAEWRKRQHNGDISTCKQGPSVQRQISSSNSDEGPRGWSKGTSSEEGTLKVRTALSNQV